MWGGKLGCVSMTTIQAQGQFHHLETKPNMKGVTARKFSFSLSVGLFVPVCLRVSICDGGAGGGRKQKNPERE